MGKAAQGDIVHPKSSQGSEMPKGDITRDLNLTPALYDFKGLLNIIDIHIVLLLIIAALSAPEW